MLNFRSDNKNKPLAKPKSVGKGGMKNPFGKKDESNNELDKPVLTSAKKRRQNSINENKQNGVKPVPIIKKPLPTAKAEPVVEKERTVEEVIIKQETPVIEFKEEEKVVEIITDKQEEITDTKQEDDTPLPNPMLEKREIKHIEQPKSNSFLSNKSNKNTSKRSETKKEPLRKAMLLTGYPKISELRCKQLTTKDIVSDNKYAYSELYSEKKDYPVADQTIILNDFNKKDKEIVNMTKVITPNIISASIPLQIIPDLDFSFGSDISEGVSDLVQDVINLNNEEPIEELVLEEEPVEELTLEEEPIEELVLEEEPVEELSLDEETPEELLSDEDPIGDIDLSLIEDISDETEEQETPLEEQETPPEELSALNEESLTLISDEEEELKEDEDLFTDTEDSLTVEGNDNVLSNISLVDLNFEETALDFAPLTLPKDESPVEDISLNDIEESKESIEVNIEEDENDYKMIQPVTTLTESQVEIIDTQTFGIKGKEVESLDNLNLGMTYDLNDIRVKDESKNVTKSFLEVNTDADGTSEQDVEDYLKFGDNDTLLSKSKSMDEALLHLR